jgi:hypothetical protein
VIGVKPSRVVIVMPPDAVENPVAFVRAAISYRIRGYRVLVPVRSTTDEDLSHVFLADPHFVAVDTAALEGAASRRFLEALAQRGTHLVARGVESPDHARAARAAGSSSCRDSTSDAPRGAQPYQRRTCTARVLTAWAATVEPPKM